MAGSDLDTPLSPSLVSIRQNRPQLCGPASPLLGTLCLGRAISRRDQSLLPSRGTRGPTTDFSATVAFLSLTGGEEGP